MKKQMCISLATIIMVFMCAMPGQAAHRHGGGGPGLWPLVGLGVGLGVWELSRPHYVYPYYSEPPVIIQQQSPDVYIQSVPQYVPAPQTPEPAYYWYYCQEPQGYYPYVNQCQQGWMKVVPTPPAPQPAP